MERSFYELIFSKREITKMYGECFNCGGKLKDPYAVLENNKDYECIECGIDNYEEYKK